MCEYKKLEYYKHFLNQTKLKLEAKRVTLHMYQSIAYCTGYYEADFWV